jgi:hypothetical protein
MSRLYLRFIMLLLILTGLNSLMMAQPTGGRTRMDFLQLPAQAKNVALGTHHFTFSGHEPALIFQSPVQADSNISDNVSVNLMPYLADTRFVNLAYGKTIKTNGTWATGIQYLNYGTMQETDDAGNVIGEFRAADYSIAVGYHHSIGPFSVGATAKLVASSIESYTTWGLAMDWGAAFRHPKKDIVIGILAKNLGFLRQNYYSGTELILPLDLRLGISFKPLYMPVRFSATIHHLNKFDMVYNDPRLFFAYDQNGLKISRKVGITEKMARHVAVGSEILLHRRFRILLGYDHLRRQELRLTDRGALAGFSYGAWLSLGRFEVSYGRAQFVPGFGSNSLSIVMNIKNGFKHEKSYNTSSNNEIK